MESINARRQKLLQQDQDLQGLPELTAEELKVNEQLQALKQEFLQTYSIDQMIEYWDVIHVAHETELFKFLYKMPKGTIHHIHDCAAWNFEKLLAAACEYPEVQINTDTRIFKISKTPVEGHVPYQEYSQTRTHKDFADIELRFSREVQQRGIKESWRLFDAIFEKLFPLVTYKPIFEAFTRGIYLDFYQENYQRLELRTCPLLNTLDGDLTAEERVALYKTLRDEFCSIHPDFGVGYIAAGFKFLPVADIEADANKMYELSCANPGLIQGYDLVCEEDTMQQNCCFNEVFAKLDQRAQQDNADWSYYFHAGETVLRGKENIYDVLLFNTVRIGHGLQVVKHPAVMQEIKERKICIELNPISNRCLGYGEDLRVHPGWTYMNHGIRCSISSDDPSIFWNHGGTYDWLWITIMWDLDLRHIKKLILNSIISGGQPEETMETWEKKWSSFIS